MNDLGSDFELPIGKKIHQPLDDFRREAFPGDRLLGSLERDTGRAHGLGVELKMRRQLFAERDGEPVRIGIALPWL